MLGKLFRAIGNYLRESRESRIIYYPIASNGYIGDCYLCGDAVYHGDEEVISNHGNLYVSHWRCEDLPIILGI